MIDSTAFTQHPMEVNQMLNSSIQSTPPQSYGNAASSAPPIRPAHTIVEMEGCTYSRTINEDLIHHVPEELVAGLHPDTITTVSERVARELDSVIIEMPSDEHTTSVCQVIQCVLRGDFDAAIAAAMPGSLAERLVQACMATKSLIGSTVDAMIQRTHTIVDLCGEFLIKLGRNEFEGDLGRWASNLTISGVRTGLTAAILTTCRQLIGFALEKNLLANAAAPLTRNVMSAIALAIGPVLNMLGGLRDEWNGTANLQTRLARLGTFTLSMAAGRTAVAAA